MGCSTSSAVASDAQPQIHFFDKYELVDVLGRGAYGTVHLAYNVESQDEVAVKIVDMHCGDKRPTWPKRRHKRTDVNAEQIAWTLIGGHPNIVGLWESFVDHSFAYFVMELCTASLLTAWSNEPDLTEYTYGRYFKEMAKALAHIHSVGIVHRDVKQDNCMVGGPDGRTVKLCDFGLAAVVVGNGQLTGRAGTAAYMAPEVVTDTATHGPPADVWSFGVIVYTAFFGSWPYRPKKHTKEEMRKIIRQGILQPSFAPAREFSGHVVSEAGIRFVRQLLARDPVTRPSAAACVDMPYLSSGRSSQLQISFVPQLNAAVSCGAFNVRTPRAEGCQQRQLIKLQSVAQLRRESRLPSRRWISMSTTATSTTLGVNTMPSRPCLYDIQGQELAMSTEDMRHCASEIGKVGVGCP